MQPLTDIAALNFCGALHSNLQHTFTAAIARTSSWPYSRLHHFC